MGAEPGEQGASRFPLHTQLCGQVPDWERERWAVDLLGLKVAMATPIPRRRCAFFSQILTKTGELSRQPTTHPEETEEELTEQQEVLLGEGALTMPREGSTESESTQEDLEEEEDEEEEEEERKYHKSSAEAWKYYAILNTILNASIMEILAGCVPKLK